MTLNNLVKAAIFSSTAIGLGFVFMFIPNLEFISVTVFLSGLTLGGYIGAPIYPPKVRPDKKTVTDMNSKFGMNIKTNPNPIAVDENIAAFTRLFRVIFL